MSGSVKERARSLARVLEVDEAVANFQKAQALDPDLGFAPAAMARRLAAEILVTRGSDLARTGNTEGAIKEFRQAYHLDHAIGRLVARHLVRTGERLVGQKQVTEAIAAFTGALEFDPKIEADSWNALCWGGSLNGSANEVMYACEHAVALEPDNGGFRDSRGLARALTNDYAGAIDDFRFYIKWGQENDERGRKNRPQEALQKRRVWIQELEAGRNPFPAALNAL
jgi:tetratricopeptide (TPR) repeat protein